MSELRRDPIIGRWVIINSDCGPRKKDFLQEPTTNFTETAVCPFCEGHESMTATEIIAYRSSETSKDKPGWAVRVFPNQSPLLHIEGGIKHQGVGMFDMMNGIGAHEIIVETPEHEKSIPDLSDSQVEKVIWAYKDRIVDLQKDERFRYIIIFKNHGVLSGANISHSHSQLIATPIIPKGIKEELEGARIYFEYKERCVFCDILQQEMSMQDRMVEENNHFAAFIPFAARFPFEVWIAPKRHCLDFTSITDIQAVNLAKILKSILSKINMALSNPSYNYSLHSGPSNLPKDASWENLASEYHWHIEIVPRLLKFSGLECGSGFFINPITPEDAAAFLRDINK